MFCVVLGLASAAYAKDPKPFQTGELVQMDSVQCGRAEKQATGGPILGTDPGGKETQNLLCQEYVLQSERVIYRIRPRAEHSVLLPVGERAQFRLENDKMLLRMEGFDGKEREYSVMSMAPRSDSSSADATPVRLNHLQ